MSDLPRRLWLSSLMLIDTVGIGFVAYCLRLMERGMPELGSEYELLKKQIADVKRVLILSNMLVYGSIVILFFGGIHLTGATRSYGGAGIRTP